MEKTKNIDIDFHRKNRRRSGSGEKFISSPPKRQKRSKRRVFVEDFDRFKISNRHQDNESECIEDRNGKPFSLNTRFLAKKCPKSPESNLNTAFVAEDIDNDEEIDKRRRRQRRLSGFFPRSLNTAFIEDSDEKENAKYSADDGLFSATEPLTPNSNLNIFSPQTPIKSKLRKRSTKALTEQDIIKYYTDKTALRKPNTLETIYEAPAVHEMTVRKYKRFINFSERMSNAKMKKRHTKVVKYKLWENLNPVTMDYFVNKMADVENDL